MIEVVNTPATVKATTEATMTLNPPEWTQVLSQFDALFSAVLKYAEPHIERMVEKKVAERVAALEERLNSITTVTDERIVEIAEAAAYQVMEDHTTNYDHDDYDNVVNNIDDRINDAIYDYDLDDKINSAIGDYDLEDKIKDTIRDMTFNVSVD